MTCWIIILIFVFCFSNIRWFNRKERRDFKISNIFSREKSRRKDDPYQTNLLSEIGMKSEIVTDWTFIVLLLGLLLSLDTA